MADIVTDDEVLAVALACVSGDEPEAWLPAIAAWRQARWDIYELGLFAAEQGLRAEEAERLAVGTFAHAIGGLQDAFSDVRREVIAALPRWLRRLAGERP